MKAPLSEWLNRIDVSPLSVFKTCEASVFHSPTPLLFKEVVLDAFGDHDDATREHVSVWVCGTCADNIEVLKKLLVASDGNVPWSVQRQFGNLIRSLVFRGWDAYQSSL